MRPLAVTIALVAGLAVGGSAGWASPAGVPCADVSASASPGIVSPGDPETVSGSVTNCSGLTETITIGIKSMGPCGFAFLRRFQLTMQPDETRDLSVTFSAPACEGLYTFRLTASKGVLLDQAETTFKVCDNCQGT